MEEHSDLPSRSMEVAATALPLNDEEYVYEDARSEECSEVEDANQVSSFYWRWSLIRIDQQQQP